MGNCSCLNSMGKSDGIMGILGMKASSPLAQPVMMVAWMTFGMRAFTMSRVPLQSLGASKLRSSMIGADTFRLMT